MKLTPILVFFLFVQFLSGQIQDKVDFVHAKPALYVDVDSLKIKGSVEYSFDVVSPIDTFFLDAHNMVISKVHLNGKKVRYTYNGKKLVVRKKLKSSTNNKLYIHYETSPKQTVYFLGCADDVEGNEQIWTQGQGKYTSHWLPSLDDMTEKVEFDLLLVSPKKYQVISNGKLERNTGSIQDTQHWFFDMEKPMSSYLVGFAIGNFNKQVLKSTSGVPIELYFEPKDSLKVEPTYRYTQHIFDFLEKEIGVPYPWQNYKQVPVQDFLYAGMENTTCTIFSNQYVIDSTAFVDKNYVNVNTHEMAHQWFGDLVTETESEHHWLHEGFATFYAYLAEQDIFGDDYFYWRLWETAQTLHGFSEDDQGEALRNPSAGSLTFYEKGAWALVMLRDRIGAVAFQKGIKNYLKKYAYQNVTIPDFMQEMEQVSGIDLSDFETIWLEDPNFPFEKVKTFLTRQSSSIKTYLELQKRIGENPENAETILRPLWSTLASTQLKQNLILDYGSRFSNSFRDGLLQANDIKVRQAILLTIEKVPEELRNEVESLLKEESYVTVESALYKLWGAFPEKRGDYLDTTNQIMGFPNKNIRLLWLTLALVTPEYRPDSKPTYFEELNGYTGSQYHFETRLLAFEYLKNIGGFNDEALKNLVDACNHHVWHFKKSARDLLNELLREEGGMVRFKSIYPLLNPEEKLYLDEKLGE